LLLPKEALAQHIAVLGKTGSGKTFAIKGIVEGLLADKRRVCIIDPTSAWWGLRSSKDGKGKGFPILVLGGDHGNS
jgi:DNA helicase HerA-like ATPase